MKRAQETEAVLQHLDDAGADDFDILGGQLFLGREHAAIVQADLMTAANCLDDRGELRALANLDPGLT